MTYVVMHTSLRHNIKQVKGHILFQHGASDCQWNFTNSDSRWSRLINCCQSGVLHLPGRRWRHDMHDIRCHAHKPTTQYQASEMWYFNLTWSIPRPMKFHIISQVSGTLIDQSSEHKFDFIIRLGLFIYLPVDGAACIYSSHWQL